MAKEFSCLSAKTKTNMDEEKALKILDGLENCGDGEFKLNGFRWANFYRYSNEASLDGTFSVEELEAIIFLCKEEKTGHDTKI